MIPTFDWLVSAGIRFSSNGVVEFQRLAGSANMLTATLARQRGEITKGELAMLRYRQRMEEIQLSQLRLGNNAAFLGAGVGVAAMTVAVSQAADLQRQLSIIQIATGASNQQMERMRSLAYEVSNATAQSVNQSAQVIGVMASSGINQIQQLNHDFVMQVAKFADVQFLKSGGKVSFAEATKEAIQLAHLYRAYTPQAITPVLDEVNKLSFMMPDSLDRYLRQASYYVPLFQRFGVPQQETLVLGAFMDRMGMGRGKGGTSLQNFLTHMTLGLQQTSHAQGGMKSALTELGILSPSGRENPKIFTNDKQGHSVIDIFQALETINDSIDKQTAHMTGPEKAAKEREMIGMIQHAFGVQGARFGYLGDAKGVQQLLNMFNQLPKMPGVNQAQSTLMGNLTGQFQRSVTNLTSVMTELGWPWLDDMTKFFRHLADDAHEFQVFLHQHKDIDKEIGGVVAVGTAMLAARAGLGTLVLAIRGLTAAANASALQIRADEALIGGGVVGPRGRRGRGGGSGPSVLPAVATEAEGGGLWRTIDMWLVGGLGGVAVSAASKVAGVAERVLTVPIMRTMTQSGKFIQTFGAAAERMGVKVLAVQTAAGGAEQALVRFLGPLGMIATILGALAPPPGNYQAEAGGLMGESRQYWLKYAHTYGRGVLPASVQKTLFGRYFTAPHSYYDPKRFDSGHSYYNPKRFDTGAAPHIHVEHVHLPNVKEPVAFVDWMQNLQKAPQTILRRSGSVITHPRVPRGVFGGGA